MKKFLRILFFCAVFFMCSTALTQAQVFQREINLKSASNIQIKNLFGRVNVEVSETEESGVLISASSNFSINETDIINNSSAENVKIEVAPVETKRIDLNVKVPALSQVKIETQEGEVKVSGNIAEAEVKTETGTISADVPVENLRYNFLWTASRPRLMSDEKLDEIKEISGGKFTVKGKLEEKDSKTSSKKEKEKEEAQAEDLTEESIADAGDKKDKPEKSDRKNKPVKLNFTTARGIILLNVKQTEIPTNLSERPLTDAAKAIIKSGDVLLNEAIRRASPKFFSDYAKTLPPRKSEPVLQQNSEQRQNVISQVKKVLVRVTDMNNRAISDLKINDFEVVEAGREREILSVEPSTAPFNLVLLLDVSGSVDNYVDFIRKTARNFVNIVSPQDKISIIIFNEDVKTLATFSLNKQKLSESLDTFDSGGATAYYDALAYVLVDSLEPLRGDRSAIVILSDGDDNRSFLPFESLLGTIQESGALVYPLYVPSGLIAASSGNDPSKTVDPLRARYLSLTSKANIEGEKLASVSGGVYYPISQLGQLQKAYEDIITQLRTAYTVTFRSDISEKRERNASPRLRVRVRKENSFVKLGSVVEVKEGKISGNNSKAVFIPAGFKNESFFLN